MADIAILVTEDHERRVKNSRKAGAGGDMEINWVSCISSMADKMVNNEMISQQNLGLLKWVLEPRSQFTLAASNGFFSA